MVRTVEAPNTVTVTLLGTSDLHGRISALPLLSSYVRIAREHASDPRRVLLIDGGDLFQGTLESNMVEGAPVIDAYNALGYTAAAIGNHEFDYGPAGDTPATDSSADPRGALRARAREARFPFLAANLLDAETGQPVRWDNVRPSVVIDVGGARVGIIGATTEETPRATSPLTFRGLRVEPVAVAVLREARALRAQGVDAVVLTAHAGGRCNRFENPDDLSSCEPEQEMFRTLRALPAGTLDAVIAGHTHQAVAHRVNGVPVVQSHANGRALGRIDLRIDTVAHRVISSQIYPPRDLCTRVPGAPATGTAPCSPGVYERVAVEPDFAMQQRLEPAFERARARRAQGLGVRVTSTVQRGYHDESALVNLVADLLREAVPGADVAITNSGGVRTDLLATDGRELTYGALYEMSPFDNELRVLRVPARVIADAVSRSLRGDRGILALSGLRATARCEGDTLAVSLERNDGTPVPLDARLTLVTTDFLAQGGDGMFGDTSFGPESAPPVATAPEPQRDAMARVLRARGGSLSGDDRALLDPQRPRVRFPGHRPVRCGGAALSGPRQDAVEREVASHSHDEDHAGCSHEGHAL